MRKANQVGFESDVYALIREARMNDFDRHTAINRLRQAESFVDAMFWVKEKLAALGIYLLKPSLKH